VRSTDVRKLGMTTWLILCRPCTQIMHVLVVLEYSLEWLFVIHLATQDALSRRDGLSRWAAAGGAQLTG